MKNHLTVVRQNMKAAERELGSLDLASYKLTNETWDADSMHAIHADSRRFKKTLIEKLEAALAAARGIPCGS